MFDDGRYSLGLVGPERRELLRRLEEIESNMVKSFGGGGIGWTGAPYA